jgi:hypothetical protein
MIDISRKMTAMGRTARQVLFTAHAPFFSQDNIRTTNAVCVSVTAVLLLMWVAEGYVRD